MFKKLALISLGFILVITVIWFWGRAPYEEARRTTESQQKRNKDRGFQSDRDVARERNDKTNKISSILLALKGGEASASMRRQLGLTDEQAVIIKEAYNQAKGALEEEMLSGLKRDSTFDEPQTHVLGYRVDAFEERADEIYREYAESLRKGGIPEANGIADTINTDPMLLGAGKSDVVIRLVPQALDSEAKDDRFTGSWQVRYELYDPKTGRRIASGTRSLKEFGSRGYRLFDEEME